MYKLLQSLILSSTLMLATSVQGQGESEHFPQLPDLGDSSLATISLEKEAMLGRSFMQSLRRQLPFESDPLIEDYVESLGYRLAAGADDKLRFQFFVVRNKEVNAFAGPGGYIGIHTGLITTAENESELASVLAHEIAHVTQRHIARRIEENSQLSIPAIAAIFAAIAVASTSPDAASALLIGSQAGLIQNQINFTRKNEKEADRIGMQLLTNAKLDPSGMFRFFQRMQKSTRLYSREIPEFLLTHPVTDSRVADAQARAAQLGKPDNLNNLSFELAKARLEVLQMREGQVKQALYSHYKGQNTVQARYYRAMINLRQKDYIKAISELSELQKQFPSEVFINVPLATALSKDGHPKQALLLLTEQLSLMPGNHPLTMALASLYLEQKTPEKARKLLASHIRNHPVPRVYQQLWLAQGRSGKNTLAKISQAEFYVLLGDYRSARQHLKQALKTEDLNAQLKSEIQARLTEINQEAKKLRS
ncbi:M48 family metalloprotease [Pelagibaculum spongiae]|nr:M48 family metalloprotease [Pelagibaculum spongiae]